jgi:diaminohydroxyphosphoribosylaminopyrimidine deaminase/5-amino-6-(5-phosphoribosylamino)uracil reductase
MAEERGSTLDGRFLSAAIRLGTGALGRTWPNPAVGAIIVHGGIVLGRGHTARGGRPHGETVALAQAGPAARGATLYVSLEPCSHHCRTPPCVDAIIAAGVARVVAAIEDPDPRVAGRGFARLRDAGIEVVIGPPSAEGRRAQAGHFSRVERGRPHVTLKLAVSADDAIGRRGERQAPVTGAIARRHAHAMRTRCDAILVGRGTVEADDPELTSRLPGLEGRSPVRVILDSDGRLGGDRKVFAAGSGETWVLAGAPAAGPGSAARRIEVPRGPSGLDLQAAMLRLGSEGITRLQVEGGARVARGLLEADLVDEVALFRSPVVLGGDAVPALAGLPLSDVECSGRFRPAERRTFGADRMTRYIRTR